MFMNTFKFKKPLEPLELVLLRSVAEICMNASCEGYKMPKAGTLLFEKVFGSRKQVAYAIWNSVITNEGLDVFDNEKFPCSISSYIDCDDYYSEDNGAWYLLTQDIIERFIKEEQSERDNYFGQICFPVLDLAKDVIKELSSVKR